MSNESQKFYVVRGYDCKGHQMGETDKYQTQVAAASAAVMLFNNGCKSVDIDLIESVDQAVS